MCEQQAEFAARRRQERDALTPVRLDPRALRPARAALDALGVGVEWRVGATAQDVAVARSADRQCVGEAGRIALVGSYFISFLAVSRAA